jgi:lysophospholipase L1-like esterase
MTRHRSAIALLAPALAACCLAAAPPAKPAPKADPDRWEKAIAAFETADKADAPKPGGVLFFGSSSIRLWKLDKSFPELPCVNRGFGGSQMSDAARYAERVVVPHKPRVLVVYSGDNDLAAKRTPEQVLASATELVRTVKAKLPDTRIVFIGVKASLKRWVLIETIRETNRLLGKLAAETEGVEFVDVAPEMLGDDGKPRAELFVQDGLHLSEAGYKLWAERLRPHLAGSGK